MNQSSIRKQFPFLNTNHPPIYLDNAATTQKPKLVIERITKFYESHYGNPGRGNHQLAQQSLQIYEEARQTVANFIHARSTKEVVFVRNTTEAINLVAHSISSRINPGDILLTSQLEHHSNLLPWIRLAQEKRARLEIIPIDTSGELNCPTFLEQFASHPVKVISLTLISNVLGTIVPVEDIFKQIKQHHPGVTCIVDAAQAVGHQPIDVQAIGCDFLTFSGHKMYGPTGIGILYGQESQLNHLEEFMVGGGMVQTASYKNYHPTLPPTKFEAGTPNVSGAVGLAAAIDFIQQIGWTNIQTSEKELTQYLLNQLNSTQIPGLTIYGPSQADNRGSLVSLNIKDIAPEDLATFLNDDGIMVRSGHHCAIPLHREILKAEGSLRISFGVYNTREEVDKLITSLQQATHLLRSP